MCFDLLTVIIFSFLVSIMLLFELILHVHRKLVELLKLRLCLLLDLLALSFLYLILRLLGRCYQVL